MLLDAGQQEVLNAEVPADEGSQQKFRSNKYEGEQKHKSGPIVPRVNAASSPRVLAHQGFILVYLCSIFVYKRNSCPGLIHLFVIKVHKHAAAL